MTQNKKLQKNIGEAQRLEKEFGGYRWDIILAVLVNRLNKSTNTLNILTIVLIILTIVLAILAFRAYS
jgi:hypothetical protein